MSLKSLPQTNDYNVMQQFGTSVFNTVVRWHKLGVVENEYTSEKLVLSAIFLPQIFTIGQNLTKFWQKISLHSFFETRCMLLLVVGGSKGKWHSAQMLSIRIKCHENRTSARPSDFCRAMLMNELIN